MPYPSRYLHLDHPQHLVQRGHNRAPVFFADDDYRMFLSMLYLASRRYRLEVYSYVLMTNHIHLLVQPRRHGAIQRTLQSLGRRYVQYINLNHRRSGTLWEGRHKASLVQDEPYLANCHAYIELNPVRAGMVSDPLDYRWSSCGHYAGGRTDPLVTDAPSYLRSGRTLAERRVVHRERLTAGIDAELLGRIRQAAQRGAPLGNDRFRAQIEWLLARRLPAEIGVRVIFHGSPPAATRRGSPTAGTGSVS